jgi:hypothetical protein
VVHLSESCDASQLEVEVFETAIGKTWLNHDAHGTEFFNAKGLQLVDVQGGQQITKVGVQLGFRHGDTATAVNTKEQTLTGWGATQPTS